MRRREFVRLLCVAVVCAAYRASAQPEPKPPYRAPTVWIRRLVVLTPPPVGETDALVQRLAETERKGWSRGRKRKKETERAADRLSRLARKQKSEGRGLSPAQMYALAETLFFDALQERLRDRLKIALVPDSEVEAALTALNLTRTEAELPQGAERLRARLDTDAVLVPRLLRVGLREAATRDIALWASVRLPGLRAQRAQNPSRNGKNREKSPPMLPPAAFTAGGAASSGHPLFQSPLAYTEEEPRLIAEAARQAAAHIGHTLQTGEVAPFQGDEKVAVAPLVAPTQADKLLFTPQGRKVAPAALQNLALDRDESFTPDVRPLFPNAVRSPEEVHKALSPEETPANLWAGPETPDSARIRALGLRLGVDYVLLARIVNIEADESPLPSPSGNALPLPRRRVGDAGGSLKIVQGSEASSGTNVSEFGARAEAVGALVRVKDGALLWIDRAAVSLTLRAPLNGEARPPEPDRKVTEQAARFALIQLTRRFQSYRAGFER